MRAGETDPVDAVHRTGRHQQVGEQRANPATGVGDPVGTHLVGVRGKLHLRPEAQRQITSVGVHVLAQEGHLGDARCGQGLHLGHHLTERPAHLGAADGRHDAERTAVVAADLDGHPGLVIGVPLGWQHRREGIGVAADRLLQDLHHRAVFPGLGQELGGPMHVVGSEDHVDVSGPCLDPLPILLGEATGDRHLQARSGLLQGLQVAQGPVEPVVGVLTDAAGVEDDHVGFGLGYGRHHPVSLEQACDSLAVMLVHLAPVGAHGV